MRGAPLWRKESRMKETWYVYMIRRSDGCLYTGMSTDPGRRFAEHLRGGAGAARYLRGRAPLELVFTHAAGTRSAAMKLERTIKKLPRAAKLSLVRDSSAAEKLIDNGQ